MSFSLTSVYLSIELIKNHFGTFLEKKTCFWSGSNSDLSHLIFINPIITIKIFKLLFELKNNSKWSDSNPGPFLTFLYFVSKLKFYFRSRESQKFEKAIDSLRFNISGSPKELLLDINIRF